MSVISQIEMDNRTLDPVLLAHELETAWTAATRNDKELAKLRIEVKSLERRNRRFRTAYLPLRRKVGDPQATDKQIAAAAIDAVRAYNAAVMKED